MARTAITKRRRSDTILVYTSTPPFPSARLHKPKHDVLTCKLRYSASVIERFLNVRSHCVLSRTAENVADKRISDTAERILKARIGRLMDRVAKSTFEKMVGWLAYSSVTTTDAVVRRRLSQISHTCRNMRDLVSGFTSKVSDDMAAFDSWIIIVLSMLLAAP